MDNNGHVLYTKENFTNEEVEAGNQIAEMVIVGGLGICKKCGDGEAGLDNICKATIRNRYKELEDVFKFHSLIGTSPQLNNWEEVELYRMFNDGELPSNDPLNTPRRFHMVINGALRFSRVACRRLK